MEKTAQLKDKIEEFLKKVEESKEGKLDLSADEDLSIAIMNLISIEEHFFFSGAKTKNEKYFDLLNKTREMRKELMKRLVKDVESGSEVWCISKHLLAASMRLIEVGTKYYSQGKMEKAHDLFSKAYELWSLFWGINLKLIDIGEVKKIEENQLNVHDKKKTGLLAKLGEIVKKIIDCCIE
jgi:tetratricopeptide (TPR) repeat protein